MNDMRESLNKKLKDYSARIAVLGLGYVGLPFATVFAEAGFPVVGVDTDPEKI
jgi:UDP-N-acetyl-D-mannosaminuronate dehydrogenase